VNLQGYLVGHIRYQTIVPADCDDGTLTVPSPLQAAYAEGIMLSVSLSNVRFQGDMRTLFYYL